MESMSVFLDIAKFADFESKDSTTWMKGSLIIYSLKRQQVICV